MNELADFIRARLVEVEAAAETIRCGGYEPPIWGHRPQRSGHWREVYALQRALNEPPTAAVDEGDIVALVPSGRGEHEHIAMHDPASVLRWVAALREILAAVDRFVNPHPGQPCTNEGQDPPRSEPCELHVARMATAVTPYALVVLAGIWSDHSDYRSEWIVGDHG